MTVSPTREPRFRRAARLLANVRMRAERLFEDGYVARRLDPHRIAITAPGGAAYELDASDRSCTCPFFVKHQGRYDCKHLLGISCLLQKQAEILRHNAAMWEAMV